MLNCSIIISSPAPWGDWDLDPKFFSSLSRWTLQHPESTLDQILVKICVGIDSGKDLMDLIPNSPFPARGLIGALAHLLQLGVVCSSDITLSCICLLNVISL